MQDSLKSSNAGFSLVELMIAVSIVGIISAFGVPKFRQLQAKAKQAEVKQNLAFIHTLETSYFGDKNEYSPLETLSSTSNASQTACNSNNSIGFAISDCKSAHYGYDMIATGNSNFTAKGLESDGTAGNMQRAFPGGCGVQDTWQIDQDKFLNNTANALGVAGCM